MHTPRKMEQSYRRFLLPPNSFSLASDRCPAGSLLFGTPSSPEQCDAADITRQMAGFTHETRCRGRLRGEAMVYLIRDDKRSGDGPSVQSRSHAMTRNPSSSFERRPIRPPTPTAPPKPPPQPPPPTPTCATDRSPTAGCHGACWRTRIAETSKGSPTGHTSRPGRCCA
jgi:hypothetical protein